MEYEAGVIRKLEKWVAESPNPGKELLTIDVGRGKGRTYSPKQVLEQVMAQTDLGKKLYAAFREDHRGDVDGKDSNDEGLPRGHMMRLGAQSLEQINKRGCDGLSAPELERIISEVGPAVNRREGNLRKFSRGSFWVYIGWAVIPPCLRRFGYNEAADALDHSKYMFGAIFLGAIASLAGLIYNGTGKKLQESRLYNSAKRTIEERRKAELLDILSTDLAKST